MSRISSRLLVALLVAIVEVNFPSMVSAQRVTDLQRGVRIRADTRSGGVVVGRLENASADSIRVAEDRQTLAFSRADIKSISTSTGPDATRGMFRTGAVAGIIGAITGAGIGAFTYKPCESKGVYDCGYVPNSRPRATVFGAVVFGVSSLVIGGAVGAVRGRDNWIPVSLH